MSAHPSQVTSTRYGLHVSTYRTRKRSFSAMSDRICSSPKCRRVCTAQHTSTLSGVVYQSTHDPTNVLARPLCPHVLMLAGSTWTSVAQTWPPEPVSTLPATWQPVFTTAAATTTIITRLGCIHQVAEWATLSHTCSSNACFAIISCAVWAAAVFIWHTHTHTQSRCSVSNP